MEDKNIKQKVVNRLLNKPKIYHIVIEGHDTEQMQKFFEEIQNKWSLYDNCVLEEAELEDTIIDYDETDDNGDFRCEETGNIICMSKAEYDKERKK